MLLEIPLVVPESKRTLVGTTSKPLGGNNKKDKTFIHWPDINNISKRNTSSKKVREEQRFIYVFVSWAPEELMNIGGKWDYSTCITVYLSTVTPYHFMTRISSTEQRQL